VIRRAVGVAGLAAACLLAAPAQAAPPLPFGHACVPDAGVLFCPTASDDQRVASWDGVPLDVDVTLPGTGDGPFPTIVMMHGWASDKREFESTTAIGGYDNVSYAARGYAVVNYSARGFGRSCGRPDSRTSPACDRGWLHVADHRFEARDTQYLLGLLVDQDIVMPDAIGVTGVSYGGVQTLNLARLRDRVRLKDGSFMRWRSPAGTPLRVKAGFARWAGSDLAYALQPNGRFLDFRTPKPYEATRPGGVLKKSYVDLFYGAGNATGFYTDGGPFSADITDWKALADLGEPLVPGALAVGRELTRMHSWTGLSGPSAALLVQNGWTDDLFPAPEALRVYRTFSAAPGATISLELGDLGHPRGTNDLAESRLMTARANRFFDAYLKGEGKAPRHGSVLAFTQVCSASARASARFRAENWERLHPATATLRRAGAQRIGSRGGNRKTAAAIDPVGSRGACATVKAERAKGTAVVRRRFRHSFTMLGMPIVQASIRTRGRGGFIAARLWDVHRGRQTLVSRGVYRLRDRQRGKILFELFGNGWRFERGHIAKLELLGRDPNYLRTSNFRFSVRVRRVRVDLPGR
jgi:predicted acyl esterase